MKELASKPLPRLSGIHKDDPDLKGLASLSDEELGRCAYGCLVCVDQILKETKGIKEEDLNDIRVMLHRLVEVIAFMRQADTTICSGK